MIVVASRLCRCAPGTATQSRCAGDGRRSCNRASDSPRGTGRERRAATSPARPLGGAVRQAQSAQRSLGIGVVHGDPHPGSVSRPSPPADDRGAPPYHPSLPRRKPRDGGHCQPAGRGLPPGGSHRKKNNKQKKPQTTRQEHVDAPWTRWRTPNTCPDAFSNAPREGPPKSALHPRPQARFRVEGDHIRLTHIHTFAELELDYLGARDWFQNCAPGFKAQR